MTPAWSHTHIPILMSESAYMSVVSFAFITEPSYIWSYRLTHTQNIFKDVTSPPWPL